MTYHRLIAIIIAFTFVVAVDAQTRKKKAAPTPSPAEESSDIPNVKWQKGPALGDLGSVAEVKVPTGYVFADGNDTRVIMEATHNPSTGRELGFVAPAGEDWFAVFEFDAVGYVRDDEKNSLDADALLQSIKTATEEGNQERIKRGWSPMTIIGWEQKPHYDELSHNLEWAIRGESDGAPVINYNTRLLGRQGVMEVTLVASPTTLAETLPKFKTMLAGFDFKSGKRYSEFRAGDKIAEYGLTGLIAGGTTAVLVKSGALKWLWKLLVAGAIALSAFFKKLLASIKRFFSKGRTETQI